VYGLKHAYADGLSNIKNYQKQQKIKINLVHHKWKAVLKKILLYVHSLFWKYSCCYTQDLCLKETKAIGASTRGRKAGWKDEKSGKSTEKVN
jgi:hypothetical protein